jgi:hypothetical protein
VALVGVLLQIMVFRRMEGEELRQTMVTIGLSIVFADLMRWAFGGDFYQIQTPGWLFGPVELPLVSAVRSSGEAVYLQYPLVRLVILAASVAVGVAMWLALNRTRIGMTVRAGVDDRDILAAPAYGYSSYSSSSSRSEPALPVLRASSAEPSSRSRRATTHASCWHRWWWSSSAAWGPFPALRWAPLS